MSARRNKTAREMNRSPGEVVYDLPVPLIDSRQMHFLRAGDKRRYLVIAPQVSGKPGAPVQVQAL